MSKKMTADIIYNDDESITIACGVSLLLNLKNMPEYYQVSCSSSDKRVRALEFMDYLFERYGIEDGDETYAEGKISKVILGVYVSEEQSGSVEQYFKEKMEEYFEDTCIIDTLEKEIDISEFGEYKKRVVPWAVVKSTDIVENGNKICIKSLENNSGTIITASDNVYVMIGSKGEVYDISREKFEASYYVSEEKLDIFNQMLDFIPTVETVPDGKCIAIDELAVVCYPKPGKNIYAKEIDSRMKVFGINNREDYFLGRTGDFLAVRIDDLKDAYIIKRDIFHGTYEKA